MSLESDRKASGARLEQNRLAIGKRLSDDLNRVVNPKKAAEPLKVLEKRGSKPAETGTGPYKGTAPPTSSGGIASPLTEQAREYFPTGVRSSDGLFQIPAIKIIQLLDADGAQVVINLKMPGT